MKPRPSVRKNTPKKVVARPKHKKTAEGEIFNDVQGVLDVFSGQLPMLGNFSEKDITGMMSLLSKQLNHIDYKSAFKGLFDSPKEDAHFTKEFSGLLNHLTNISKMMTKDLH